MIMWSENITSRYKHAPETLEPFQFSYITSAYFILNNDNITQTLDNITCSVKNSYVEVGVLCVANSTCRAAKVRRSQLPQFPPAFTFMDLENGRILSNFMRGFMMSIGGDDGDSIPSVLNNYLKYPSLIATPSTSDTSTIKIPDETLNDRLGHLLNSYWTCAYSTGTLTQGINSNNSYFWDKNITFEPLKRDGYNSSSPRNYNWTWDRSSKSKVWSSQGNKYEHIDVIVAHKPWTVTLAIASLVLIVFSLVPPLVRHFLTNGPGIAMNFSGLATRNNNHVPIPAGGSFLPASDRFRLLKDLRLRFADAESKSDVGNLVIAAQGVGKAGYSRVRKGRMYE